MLQVEQVLHGRYQLQQQLGNNAGRQTWLAVDRGASPAETVIVKLLAFSPHMQWDDLKLFEREAMVLQQLNHPRIPQYRDYFSLEPQTGAGLNWFGLVQQYIPSSSLSQLLHQGQRFSQSQVQNIAQSVLQILIYLHNLNPPVLHRDIKPSNLILGEDGEVYLVDFGAVQDTAAGEGVTFTVVGTTGYAPLEQFWGRAVPASDLYALGATLIHLLTGTPPADLPQRDLHIQFRDRVSLHPHFLRWIEILTAPDVEQRFADASQALEALQTNRHLNRVISNYPQPVGSHIQIHKSPQQLWIKIFKQRSLFDLLKLGGNLLLTIGSLPFLLLQVFAIMTLIIVLFFTLFYNVLFFLVCLVLLIFMGWLGMATSQEFSRVQEEVAQALRQICEQYSIYFNSDYFVIERQILGLSYLRQVGKLSEIKGLKKIPFRALTIQTKTLTYSLAQDLTELERDWLFQEIHDWLNDKL